MKITKETLKQLVMEELKATLDEQARAELGVHATLPDGTVTVNPRTVPQQKASRAMAMANQHLKQVTKIMARSGTGQALSGIEGAKAKDQLAQAIEQLQALDAYLEDITGESGSFSYHTDRGAPDKAVRQGVNPRPIRTKRGGTPRK